MRLKYEPSSEPIHIYAKYLFLTGPHRLVDGGELAAPADDALHVLPQEHLPTTTEFKLPWREACPPNHHDDKVDSDQ